MVTFDFVSDFNICLGDDPELMLCVLNVFSRPGKHLYPSADVAVHSFVVVSILSKAVSLWK